MFLDMDEVLVDWTTGACALLGIPRPSEDDWPSSTWDMMATPNFPMSKSEALSRIDAAGSDFWASLKPTPWVKSLMQLAEKVGEPVILTQPSCRPHSAEGKLEWIYEHLGPRTNYLMGNVKWACAAPSKILIDDKPSNVDSFTAHGGKAVLFPAIGNTRRACRHDPIPAVADYLRQAGLL